MNNALIQLRRTKTNASDYLLILLPQKINLFARGLIERSTQNEIPEGFFPFLSVVLQLLLAVSN